MPVLAYAVIVFIDGFGEFGECRSRSPIFVSIESPYANFANLHPISHRFEVITDYCSNLVRRMVTAFFLY